VAAHEEARGNCDKMLKANAASVYIYSQQLELNVGGISAFEGV
jgi:hypothetical protein